MRKSLIATLLAAFGLIATGCGNDSEEKRSSPSGIAESEEFNQADVDFATAMIQHHAQGLSMVDLTDGRELSPALAALAEQIRMAQGPEIEVMVDLLNDFDQPIPETVRDHVNGHGKGDGEGHGTGAADSGVPGVMSAEELSDLEGTSGAKFEGLFLTAMIEHHEGAIEMAQTEQTDGEFPEAITLAEQIEESQKAEIATMKELLDS